MVVASGELWKGARQVLASSLSQVAVYETHYKQGVENTGGGESHVYYCRLVFVWALDLRISQARPRKAHRGKRVAHKRVAHKRERDRGRHDDG